MIYKKVVSKLPKFKKFLSVSEIQKIIQKLEQDARFKVTTLGKSKADEEIKLVTFGKGKIKTLFMGFPHPNEPMGGLTVAGLIHLLKNEDVDLMKLDVEWNFIPCADPDGARLNEGWSQKKFDFKKVMQNFHRQRHKDQTEWSFPVERDGYKFNTPSPMTKALMKALKKIRPDFYFSLHNSFFGGAYFYMKHFYGNSYLKDVKELLKKKKIPLHLGEPELSCAPVYSPAFYGEVSFDLLYEQLSKYYEDPTPFFTSGRSSFDFLEDMGVDASTLVCELPFIKHPDIMSSRKVKENRRKLHIQLAARKSVFFSRLRDELLPVEKGLNKKSAFFGLYEDFKKFSLGNIDRLPKAILEDPEYNRQATVSEKLDLTFGFYYVLCYQYQLVRLVKDSKVSAKTKQALKNLNRLFDQELKELTEEVDFSQFSVIEPQQLAEVQLSMGLIQLEYFLKSKKTGGKADR